MGTDLGFYRARVAWVLGISGCCAVAFAACGPKSTTAGLLVAPTAAPTASSDAAAAPAGDGGRDDADLRFRPLPEEQHATRGQSCDREVTCTPPLDAAPTWSYPPPFDKCGTTPNSKDGEGTLSQAETVDRRKREADACCYVKLDCGGSRGRGRGHGQVRIVPGRPRRGAAPDDATSCGKWTAMARMERASVEAFLDFEADLRGHGAPEALWRAAHAAAGDEASHARLCLGLAARDGEDTSAATSASPRRPASPASLEELVASIFLDGCVNEQLAAASLREAARRASSEEERRILERIADEEQGHAELSWAALRWAVGAKAGAREALREALAKRSLLGAPADELLLDEATGASLGRAMLESVVLPAAYALIAA